MKVCCTGDNPVPRQSASGYGKDKDPCRGQWRRQKTLRQKGTGRARAVLMHHRYGFVVEKLTVRSRATIIRKFQRRCAGLHASALSSRAQDEKVMVVESISCETPKTRTIVDLLKALSVSGKKNLLIIDKEGKTFFFPVEISGS